MKVQDVFDKSMFWLCDKTYEMSHKARMRLMQVSNVVVVLAVYGLAAAAGWKVWWAILAAYTTIVPLMVATTAVYMDARQAGVSDGFQAGASDGLLRGFTLGLRADSSELEHLLEELEALGDE